MELNKALAISARGMEAQTTRLRTIAENLANQDTTASTPEAEPYRRKLITFESRVDRELGADTVEAWDEGRTGDVIMPDPKVHIGRVEDGEKGEPPANSVNDDLLAASEELIDDGAKKENVDQRPVAT